MKTYRELLNELQSLAPEQLDVEIVILNDGMIQESTIDLIVSEEPLFQFNDTNMEIYYDFETEENAEEYDAKKIAFENEKVLLIGDQLKEREKEVSDLDKKIKNIINSRFGSNGEINGARANLVKPFQDQIWGAIKTVVDKNTLGIVLDKSNNISVLFLDNRYDYTDKVLDVLLKNTSQSQSQSSSDNARSNDKTKTNSSRTLQKKRTN